MAVCAANGGRSSKPKCIAAEQGMEKVVCRKASALSFGQKVRIQEERPRSIRRCPPGELGFAVNDQRKNRKSHRSQRNGLTNSIDRIRSMIPERLD
jgi:hypothetical protein